jgi:hypothetical protein
MIAIGTSMKGKYRAKKKTALTMFHFLGQITETWIHPQSICLAYYEARK